MAITRRAFLAGLGVAGAAAGAAAVGFNLKEGAQPAVTAGMDPGMTMPGPMTAEDGPVVPGPATEVVPLPGTTFQVPPLLYPPLSNGTRTFQLNMQQGQVTLGGRTVNTFGINGPYLAPTLRASRGDKLSFAVANGLGEATTLHWHGMHLPAVMDGGPMQEIPAGQVWRPSYAVNQEAATLWYHPHTLGVTRRQVQRGLVGLFILDDQNAAQAALPKTYGADDFPLILHDNLNGGGTLVNGSLAPILVVDRGRLRFRILNATDQQILSLGWAGNQGFLQIGSDGGLLASPAQLTRLTLGPGERAEILVDGVSADQNLTLQRLNGGGANARATLLTVRGAAQVQRPEGMPAVLNQISRLNPSSVATTRQFVLGNGSRINGQQMSSMTDMMNMATALRVRLGDVERWDVRNTSRDTHVLHIHDAQFQVMTRNGAAPAAGESGWKDSVLMPPGDNASLLMHFADYADPETPYMYHCHVLEHEDEGMMGHFVVMPT